jgi:hypothetical protein
MEKLPLDLPENLNPPGIQPTGEPRLVRPSSGRIWFMAVLFLLPLLLMIIFAIVFVAIGLQTN